MTRRLRVVQDFGSVDPHAVTAAYRSDQLHAHLRDLPFVGSPELVSHVQVDGGDRMESAVRWKVRIDLPGVALAFVDPEKLVFVEHSDLHDDGTGTFRIVPEHYAKLLRASGETTVTNTDGLTTRTTTGRLRVDLGWQGKLFEGQVTDAIATGLRRSLEAQVPQVLDFVTSQG